MATDIWLNNLSTAHLNKNETPEDSDKSGHLVLNKNDIKKLTEIIDWLEDNKCTVMMFWRWKKFIINQEDNSQDYYWRFTPVITFFRDEDAVHFKFVWSAEFS